MERRSMKGKKQKANRSWENADLAQRMDVIKDVLLSFLTKMSLC